MERGREKNKQTNKKINNLQATRRVKIVWRNVIYFGPLLSSVTEQYWTRSHRLSLEMQVEPPLPSVCVSNKAERLRFFCRKIY